MRICTYSFNCFYVLQTGCLHVRKSSMASTYVLQICLRLLYVYRYVYIYTHYIRSSVCTYIQNTDIIARYQCFTRVFDTVSNRVLKISWLGFTTEGVLDVLRVGLICRNRTVFKTPSCSAVPVEPHIRKTNHEQQGDWKIRAIESAKRLNLQILNQP